MYMQIRVLISRMEVEMAEKGRRGEVGRVYTFNRDNEKQKTGRVMETERTDGKTTSLAGL